MRPNLISDQIRPSPIKRQWSAHEMLSNDAGANLVDLELEEVNGPDAVWQTLMGKELGARLKHFCKPDSSVKYWVTPSRKGCNP